ncbi:unnamed protein product [Paramecium octaurelia]|uniref:Uncharacterized protein n=1 Tax=Paramecium octaurelia TaxID=43137 RepID=A0A8S1S667_PAROT|nr:unnamed protein product [Paramecium octaurelia]
MQIPKNRNVIAELINPNLELKSSPFKPNPNVKLYSLAVVINILNRSLQRNSLIVINAHQKVKCLNFAQSLRKYN